jgi:predicted DNA-binding protein with PD1-like motif
VSEARRHLRQPGLRRAERWIAVTGPALSLDFALEPGLTLNEAVTRPMISAGILGGTIELSSGAFGPLGYVMPALSTDPRYAAFYSEQHLPPGRTKLERAVATMGERDGAPFIHCHGVWMEEDGARRGGHILPLDTIVREPIRARAYGAAGASFAVLPDPETNFALFTPVSRNPGNRSGPRVVLLKVQPNEPLEHAIVAACQAHHIVAASLFGIGSLVGAAFADGRYAPSVATELFIKHGRVALGPDGAGTVEIDIALVDTDGVIHEGRLAPGNPVCITCELCLVETRP